MLLRLAALLLLAAPAAAQRVSPSITPGPGRTCTALGGDEVCRTPVENADGPTAVGRMTRCAATWDVGGGPFVHDIRLVDLGPMRAVATLGAVSNGLGVSYWTVDLVPPRSGPPVASFSVEEFAPEGRSTETRAGQMIFWATEWWSGPDPDGRRAEGTYLVGRPFVLTAGGLVPAARLSIRARRMRTDFRTERGGPVRWPRDRRAVAWRTDPMLGGRPDVTRGVVTSATLASLPEDGPVITVTLRTDAGADLEITSNVWDTSSAFAYVGDGATGRLWPAGYRPADVSAWLVGHRVRIEVRGDSPTVLWRE